MGHAAEINKGYACKHNGDNLSTSNKNCLLVRSLSPPKSPTDNVDKKRKPVNIKEKERSHENGMPLVCLNSTAHSSPHSQKYNQQSAEHAVDQYELIGLYSDTKVLNLHNLEAKQSRLKTKETNGLQFLHISPYLRWIQVRLGL